MPEDLGDLEGLPDATEEDLAHIEALGDLQEALLVTEWHGIPLDMVLAGPGGETRTAFLGAGFVGIVPNNPHKRQQTTVLLPHDIMLPFANWLIDQHEKVENKNRARVVRKPKGDADV